MKQLPETVSNLTPIEIALQVDGEGFTTARKLYEFLELIPKNYSHWIKRNILNNPFAIENADFTPLVVKDDYSQNRVAGQFAQDFKISANFAKRLAMASNSPKGELARNYFVTVEDNLKKAAIQLTAAATISTALVAQLQHALLTMISVTDRLDKIITLLEGQSQTGVLTLAEAAEMCHVSHVTFGKWLYSGITPMGPITEGVHYFRLGESGDYRREYRFIKRQLGILFRMWDE